MADTSEDGTPAGRPELPKGFDPATDVRVDARSLRGMAHPLRSQILGVLRAGGASTATKIGQRLGQSSAATSYHLRQLATYGFIEEVEGRGTTRERWWRARHRSTWFDKGSVVREAEAGEADLEETSVLADDYQHYVVDQYAQNLHRWLDRKHGLPDEWREVGETSDSLLRLTAAEAVQLNEEVREVVYRYRTANPEYRAESAPEDAQLVTAQWQVFPFLFPGDPVEPTEGGDDDR